MTRQSLQHQMRDMLQEINQGLVAVIELIVYCLLWTGLAIRDSVLWCWREGKSIIEDAWEKL